MAVAESRISNSDFPPGYAYNPEIVTQDYGEQVETAWNMHAYQQAPNPSFEGVPVLDLVPAFNPTGAPTGEIYAHSKVPESFRRLHHKTYAEIMGIEEPVEIWRIAEKGRVVDGTALVSSRILQDNSLGNVESFKAAVHLASNHEGRMASPDKATPFISFATDPRSLAKVILRRGFGLKEGRDPVIVRVHVDPSRVITPGRRKEPEVLLIGGVAPEEYVAAYSVADFVSTVLDPDEQIDVFDRGSINRDEALQHWTGRA